MARAEQARADYARMKQEYRARMAAKGIDPVTADIRFGGMAIVKECIDDEQMYSRWASENNVSANTEYALTARLMEELRTFLSNRRARVPAQR